MNQGIDVLHVDTHDEWSFWNPPWIFLFLKYGIGGHGGGVLCSLKTFNRASNSAMTIKGSDIPDRSWNRVYILLQNFHPVRNFLEATMSRLIVKNLPTYLTPDRLRKHFGQTGAPPGTITDVKISLKPDGTSRRFGFVGFKTDHEATAARDWFDRTFIDSTRINVMVVEVSFFSVI